MPQVTCPQCGAVNGTGTPEYPFCIGCQDNLAKCGYCRWFDADPALCTNREVAGVFDVAADATPPCDQYEPMDSILVPNRSFWAVVAVGLVAALVLVYSIYQFSQPTYLPPEKPQASLQWKMTGDLSGAAVGRPFRARVEIRNTGTSTVGGIRLQISKESVPVRFRLEEMAPAPTAREDARQWMSYIYPDIAPNERLAINLELVPRQPGDYQMSVRLLSRGTTFHGAMRLPVQVAAAPKRREAGGPVQ